MGSLKMKKVEIIGEIEKLDRFLVELQELSVLHVEDSDFELKEGEKIRSALNDKEKELLRKIERGIYLINEIRKEELVLKVDTQKIEFGSIEDLILRLNSIYQEYQRLKEEERKILEERSLYFSFKKILEAFEELVDKKEIELNEEFNLRGVLLSREDLILLERVREALRKDYGEKVKIFHRVIKGNQIAVLIAHSPSISEELKERLWKEGFPELVLPHEIAKLSFKEMLSFLKKKLMEIPEKLKENELRKKDFIEKNISFLYNSFYILEDLRDLLSVKEKGVYLTKYFFYLEGFLPEKEIDKLRELVKRHKCYIRESIPKKEEYKRVPVLLKNSSFFKNFEPFIEFFSLPVYRTYDPTPLLGLFFPLYYGFMLGDIGYGFLGLLLFSFIYFRLKNNFLIKRVSYVFVVASIFSIIFGILYMEMFGDVLERFGFKPIFHRVHEANTYLLLAIIFGTSQVILGLILGIINAFVLGHKEHAIGVLSMLMGLICVLMIALSSLGIIPSSFNQIFLLMLLIFMVLSFRFHGPAAPIEIFSAFGHILSFARLMAIGLSSAIIAVIANKFINLLPSILVGITVMLLFHMLAFLLGIFDPTIQGLRLQFVEFFTKFYVAGGREYRPLFKRFKEVQILEIR
ncbi:MAG: V-type ATPase 116kDa subunit family protein [Candidatus Hydrothermales bacterium]